MFYGAPQNHKETRLLAISYETANTTPETQQCCQSPMVSYKSIRASPKMTDPECSDIIKGGGEKQATIRQTNQIITGSETKGHAKEPHMHSTPAPHATSIIRVLAWHHTLAGKFHIQSLVSSSADCKGSLQPLWLPKSAVVTNNPCRMILSCPCKVPISLSLKTL